MLKKILIIFSLIFFFSLGGLIFFYHSVKDEVHGIVDHTMEKSSIVYDRNQNKIANIIGSEYRLYVKFEDIPPRIIEALLAIEDTTFFEHNGINLEAIFRAGIKDIVAMKKVEGASTITQQYVKNAVLTREKSIYRKLKEVFLSVEIEKLLSKEEILERYLNLVYFGGGFYGIRTAAWGYFKKDLEALTLKEISMLVGLIKAPSFYDPSKNYDYSIGRANRVISRMYEDLGWITEQDYKKAIDEKPKAERGTKTENVAPYVIDYIVKELSEKYPDLRTGGYVIETTIDLDIQEIARKALKNGYNEVVAKMKKDNYPEDRIEKFNGAFIALNQQSGEILSMIGGVDYEKSPFNRVTQGNRQIGSSIKPFFYQTGLNLGYSGASILNDVQKTYDYTDGEGNEQKWKPQNYSKKVLGRIKFREALYRSRNLATIDLVDKLGANNFYKELYRFGFTDLTKDLSTALGSYSTSMINLAKEYTIISNYGSIVELRLIRKILKDGETLFQSEFSEKRINPERQAYLMIDIMKDVVQKGSGRRAKIHDVELAGKTGTTDDGKDVWFNSFLPEIQTHVWFGNDDNSPILDSSVSAGAISAPVAKDFYLELFKIRSLEKKWRIPEGVNRYKFDGIWENFTDISKPPSLKSVKTEDEPLIF